MTSPLRALVLAAALLLPTPARAQSLALDHCDTPRVPLGRLTGEGRVLYRLAEDGHPDTGTVAVLAVSGVSAAGFRSAAVRELSACRMKRLHDAHDGVRVTEQIAFVGERGRTTIRIAPPDRATEADIPLLTDPRLAQPSHAAILDDSLVEEHPRGLGCNGVFMNNGPTLPAGRYRSEAEAHEAFEAWARQHSGHVQLLAVVGVDGRVPRDQISVVASDNPTVTNDLTNATASCRFTPGRVGGEPVPTRMVVGQGIEYRDSP